MVTKAKKRALAKKPKKTKSKLAMPVPVPQNDSSDFVVCVEYHILNLFSLLVACHHNLTYLLISVDLSKPLEGGSGGKIPQLSEQPATATVLYVGRIPHGFYEDEMEGCFLSPIIGEGVVSLGTLLVQRCL